ncbi:S8 family peptidase [Aminipila butyrica]|uniref:S8 family peptidase n=1 Tax=Aminipila butyrica TaxID=433296 RepID=A0A858BTF9_9FIRM|nr:S8 family peptidase [Aminipila butyrica]QIB68479.1 S8 family peptidase [Aminipila butyrica]
MIYQPFLPLDQLTRFTSDQYSDSDMLEVIVKYSGDIMAVGAELDAFVEILDVNYAILTISLANLAKLYQYNEVEYVELPKNLTYFLRESLNSACISQVQRPTSFNLTGAGVAIGIIDSGIDYTHSDFQNQDGSTRILFLWDQTIDGNPPMDFRNGSEYTKAQIDEALASDTPYEFVPSRDTEGHGTAVAGVAAGNGRGSDSVEKGVAPNASLIVVKLGHTGHAAFTRTTEIMRAIKYIYAKAQEVNMPVSINISYGTNNGSHDGSSLFEGYIDNMTERWRSCICVAAGNEASAGHHYSNLLTQGATDRVEFSISDNISSLYMTIWKNFVDTMTFSVISPSGRSTGEISPFQRVTRFTMDGVLVSVLYGQPTHYNTAQEIYILFRGVSGPMPPGLWALSVRGLDITYGLFDIWLPPLEEVGQETDFLRPTVTNTITIPATAHQVISVGGYNSTLNSMADFSGQGTLRNIDFIKPDLVAPAVNILTTKAGGGYDRFTGTSVAAPFVTGSAALMMEWGLLQGNDPLLYGQRIKAFLWKGAERLPNLAYPNPVWGYGSLSLCDTMDLLVEYNQSGFALT